MPSVAAPSASARRSARRSGDGPSASASPSKLTPDDTCLDLLRNTVLESSFKPIKDPNNVMSRVWVREGKDMEEDEEGVDWIREDGFQLSKFIDFWRTEMADHQATIVAWAKVGKLPPAAWAHLPEELQEELQPVEEEEDEEEEEVEVAKVSPENKRKKAAGKPTKARKKRKTKKTDEELEDEYDWDTDDGLHDVGCLLKLRDEWFALLNSGHALIGQDKVKKSDNKSISKMKARADKSIADFTFNYQNDPKVEEFRLQKMDPMMQRIRKEIHAEINKQAAKVTKQYFESFRAECYRLKSETAADEDDVVEKAVEAAEKEGEAGTTDGEGGADEEVAAINEEAEAAGELSEAEVDVEE